MQDDAGGTAPRAKRFFCGDGEVFHHNGKTYVLSHLWGNKTVEAADSLGKMFPSTHMEVTPTS